MCCRPSLGGFFHAFSELVGICNALLSLNGNFVVKSPDILEGLFEKSFCSTKQVTLFLSS